MTFRLGAVLAARGLDVSLSIAPGETLAILGPNGAGKSTLLDITAGLLRPDSGFAELNGQTLFRLEGNRPTWMAPHRRKTVLLAQEALLFPHLSVLDNVAFGPRSAGTGRAAALSTARHWLREVDAVELADRRPSQLSGGQAQRVAVARALAADPELLLLDEPMAALDISSAPLLRRLLKRVLANRQAIVVSHDPLDAYLLADRVAIVENGRILEQGPTRQVLERPRSRFAAGLAGLNLVAGETTPGGLRGPEGKIISGRWETRAEPGQPAVAVFPPSAVAVFLAPPHGSPRNVFSGTVTELEPHGDQIRVRAAGLSADITPAAAAELALVPGTAVHLLVKSAEITLYPA